MITFNFLKLNGKSKCTIWQGKEGTGKHCSSLKEELKKRLSKKRTKIYATTEAGKVGKLLGSFNNSEIEACNIALSNYEKSNKSKIRTWRTK